jgi:hypothetical protein
MTRSDGAWYRIQYGGSRSFSIRDGNAHLSLDRASVSSHQLAMKQGKLVGCEADINRFHNSLNMSDSLTGLVYDLHCHVAISFVGIANTRRVFWMLIEMMSILDDSGWTSSSKRCHTP